MMLSWQSGAAGAGHAARDRRRHLHLPRAPGGASCRRSRRCASRCDHGRCARQHIQLTCVPCALRVLCAATRLVRGDARVVREACFGLYHHRFRAALSMLGISWGIISVVVLLAYGDGFRGALDAGLPRRVLGRHRRHLPGPDEPAGGWRARRQARPRHARRRDGDRRAAAGEERQPRVHAASSRSSTATSSRATWFAAWRRRTA